MPKSIAKGFRNRQKNDMNKTYIYNYLMLNLGYLDFKNDLYKNFMLINKNISFLFKSILR